MTFGISGRLRGLVFLVGIGLVPLLVDRRLQEESELSKRGAAVVLAILLVGAGALVGDRCVGKRARLVLLLAWAFVGWQLFIWPTAYRPSQAGDAVFLGLENGLLAAASLTLMARPWVRRHLLTALGVAATAAASVGLLQYGEIHLAGAGGDPLGLVSAFREGRLLGGFGHGLIQTDPPGSFFGHTNVAAEFVALGAIGLVSAALLALIGAIGRRGIGAWLLAVAALPALAFLALSGSRSAFLSWTAVFAVFLAASLFRRGIAAPFFGRRSRHFAASVAMLGAMGAAGVGLAGMVETSPRSGQDPVSLFDRIGSAFDPSNTTVRERLDLWGNTWVMARAHPVFGVGPGNFRIAYPEFAEAFRPHEVGRLRLRRQPERPHDEYLHVLAENGAIGLLLWSVPIVLALLAAVRVLHRGEADEKSIVGRNLAAFLVLLGTSVFGFPLQLTACRLAFWGLLSSLVAAADAVDGTGDSAVTGRRPRPLILLATLALGLVLVAHHHARAAASREMRSAAAAADQAFERGEGPAAALVAELRHVDAACAREPSRYPNLLRRAELLRLLGRLPEAEKAERRALELHPFLINAQVGLAEILLARGRIEEAAAAAAEARRLNPREARAQLVAGRCEAAAGRPARAATFMLRALDLDPDGPDRLAAHLELVRLYDLADEIRAADAHLRLARELGPDELAFRRVEALWLEHRTPGSPAAAAAWTRLLEADPYSAEAQLRVGLADLDAGRPGQALEKIEQAFALDPENTDILYHRGRALLGQGRLLEARDSLFECMLACVRRSRDSGLWSRCRELVDLIEKELVRRDGESQDGTRKDGR